MSDTANTPEWSASARKEQPWISLDFTGRPGEFFKIWITNLLFTLGSCGLYGPWAWVCTRRYFLSQTRLQGSSFYFQAKAGALFLGWILISLGFGLLGLFSDLLSAGLSAVAEQLVRKPWVVLVVTGSVGLLTLLIQATAMAWLLMQSQRYNANRTTYRNLRFGFGSSNIQRQLWAEMAVLMVMGFLVVLSLGLLQPYAAWRWRRFLIKHRRFGTTAFTFTATPADFYRLHGQALPLLLLGLFGLSAPLVILLAPFLRAATPPLVWIGLLPLSPLLLLLWSCWLEAHAAALTWRSTRLGELKFECGWRVRALLRMKLVHGLLLMLSFGLAWPSVRIWATRYRLQRIRLGPAAALNTFLAAEEEQMSDLAKGAFAMGDDNGMAGLFDISL